MGKSFFPKLNFNWRAYLAEFTGTFVFVLVASLAAVSSQVYPGAGTVGVALATGLILSAVVFATVSVSGGNINPAVTLSLWFAQKLDTVSAVFYIISQIAGSFVAALVVWAVFAQKGVDFALGGPVLGDGVTMQVGLIVEAILTAALVFVVFATMVDKRGPVSFGPLAIGLLVVCCAIAAGPVTGVALNPARAIGPLVLSGKVDMLLVWIVGPITGSLFGLVYEFLFLRKSKK